MFTNTEPSPFLVMANAGGAADPLRASTSAAPTPASPSVLPAQNARTCTCPRPHVATKEPGRALVRSFDQAGVSRLGDDPREQCGVIVRLGGHWSGRAETAHQTVTLHVCLQFG